MTAALAALATGDPLDPGRIGIAGLLLLALAAATVGLAKTSIGGFSLITVAVFAALLPSRQSTGVLLPLLLVGDVLAVRTYHAHADWRALLRLIPAVALGIGAGVVFVARVDDTVMRRAIGIVLLGLVVLHLVMLRRGTAAPRGAALGFGSLAGFTTMVANAGGPAMSLYLLGARYPMLSFLGTTSWFFFVVNLIKLPFSVGLGLVTPAGLRIDLLLAPAVVIGGLIGRWLMGRLDQRRFEWLVLATTALGGLNLLR